MGDYVEMTFSDTDAPDSDAQRIYLKHFAALSEMKVGTPELRALMDRLPSDSEYQENAAEILKLPMHGPMWIKAFIRSTAKEAARLLADREVIEKREAYAGNVLYGAF